MSLIEHFMPNGPSGFGYGSTAEQVTNGLSLAGKTYLVTGCNSGLGAETMRVLALRGARVVGTARSTEKAAAACAQVSGDTVPMACELSDLRNVQECVESVKRAGIRLDGIIANAGIMALPKLQQAHGYELQFFTNHMGHFTLVTGLLGQLTPTGRVVMLSSTAHTMAPKGGIDFDNLSGEKSYRDWTAYGQSKFANLVFARALARRLAGTGQTANAVHPGVIETGLARHTTSLSSIFFAIGNPLVLKSVGQGAATQVFVATHPSLANVTGEYFADCNVKRSRRDAEDPAVGDRLWEVSERILREVLG